MASSNDSVVRFEEICRTCMGCPWDPTYGMGQENPTDKSFQLQSVFGYVEVNKNERARICDILSFVVHQLPRIDIMDEMPSNICTSCLEKLFACYEFQKSVKNSDRRLRNLLETSLEEIDENWSNGMALMETGQIQNDINTIQSFIKQEIDFDDLVEDKIIMQPTSNVEIIEKPSGERPPNDFVAPISKKTIKNKLEDGASKERYKKVWQCKYCSECFSDKRQLSAHFEKEKAKCKSEITKKTLQPIVNSNENQPKPMEVYEQYCSTDLEITNFKNTENKTEESVLFETSKNLNESEEQQFETWLCKKCENIFFHKPGIEKHMHTVHNEELAKHENFEIVIEQKNDIHKCDECDQVFLHLAFLKLHKYTHRTTDQLTTVDNQKILIQSMKCDRCEENFKNLDELNQHILTHKGPYPFQCRLCHKSFRYNCHLLKHELTHSKEQLFFCARCRQAFNTLKGLEEHAQQHENEKRFKCSFCTRKFHSYSGAYSHQRRVHSKEMMQQMQKN